MTCPDCQTAQARPWHGFRADCKGCQVRALTRSPEYEESRRSGAQTPAYRAALKVLGVSHKTARFVAESDPCFALWRKG